MLALLRDINDRLARLEGILLPYLPLLQEAARRISGPLNWKRKQG